MGTDLVETKAGLTDEHFVLHGGGEKRNFLIRHRLSGLEALSAPGTQDAEGRMLTVAAIDLSDERTDYLSAADLLLWSSAYCSVPLVEYYFGVHKIPQDPQTLLVHRHRAEKTPDQQIEDYYVYDPAAPVPGGIGAALRNLADGSIYHLEPGEMASLWRVAGTTKTLKDVLYRWNSYGQFLRSWHTARSTALAMLGSAAFGVVGAQSGLGLGVVIGGAALCVAAIPVTAIRHTVAMRRNASMSIIKAAYHAADATDEIEAAPVAISSSLADRMQHQAEKAGDLSQVNSDLLSSILTTGRYVLTHLHHLSDPLSSEESRTLLLDHLPLALELHAKMRKDTLSQSYRQRAEEDLEEQLGLIKAEVEAVQERIESAMYREQVEHTRFLGAKLRRSDLDLP